MVEIKEGFEGSNILSLENVAVVVYGLISVIAGILHCEK
jgi:hypothetical protein